MIKTYQDFCFVAKLKSAIIRQEVHISKAEYNNYKIIDHCYLLTFDSEINSKYNIKK